MQRFWYNSPVKFFRIESDFEDVLNPQNVQSFGEIKPYTLEKGVIHRFLIPEYNNETDFFDNFTLYVVSGFIKKEIICDVFIALDKIKYITFLCSESISGYLQLNYGNTILYKSNCVRFADTSQSDIKYARVITKHNYNRQLFDFQPDNAYFVTNIPIYEDGDYRMEAEITNERIGGISTLQTKETYLDEVVNYELAANGNGDIINFVQSNLTNTEFYLNGTQRTSIDKLDVDDNGMFAKLKLVNVKDENGFNITIDEDVVFADLDLKLVSFTPLDNSYSTQDNFNIDNRISLELNKDVKINPSKFVKIYRNGVLWAQKNGSQITKVGRTLIINDTSLNPSDLVFDVAQYYILIEHGLIYTDFGKSFSITDSTVWNFGLTENTQQLNFIQWIDGTEADKTGNQDSATAIIKPGYSFVSSIWQEDLGSGFNDIAGSTNQSMIDRSLQNGLTKFRNIAFDSFGIENVSNILRYTKLITPTLKSVVKLSENTGRFVWNNNGIDYGSGSAVFQVSTDNGLNWTNFQTLAVGTASTDNVVDISSPVLSSLPLNISVKFRVVCSGNGLTNITSNNVDVVWQKTARIFIPPLSIVKESIGNCSYQLHVEDADFEGFVITRADIVSNVKRIKSVFTFGETISFNNVQYQTFFKNKQITIPKGVYNCYINLSCISLSSGDYTEGRSMIAFSSLPDLTGTICEANVSYIES